VHAVLMRQEETCTHTHTYAHTRVRRFDEVKDLHIALLVITIVLALLYIYYALWPYEKEVKHEVRTCNVVWRVAAWLRRTWPAVLLHKGR